MELLAQYFFISFGGSACPFLGHRFYMKMNIPVIYIKVFGGVL